MKLVKNKIVMIVLFGVIAVLTLSSTSTSPILAQVSEGESSFGVDIQNATTASKVDGDINEPNNHWVHKNGLLWSEIEKAPGIYSWEDNRHVEQLDAYLKTIHEAGMEVILTIRSTPDWARSHDQSCGPMDEGYIKQFAEFVSEVVQRYTNDLGYVNYFEIWNEPDAPFVYFENMPSAPYGCWGNPDVDYFGGSYYGEMLKAVYHELKTTSPDAQLVIGGLLLPADPEDEYWKVWERPGDDWPYADMSKFFEGILQTENDVTGWPYFDYVNFHGYSYYYPDASAIEIELMAGAPEPFWDHRGGQVEGKMTYLKSIMDKYGVDKPFIITESGLLGDNITDYDPAFEETKSEYLVWTYTRNMARGFHSTIWYQLDNYGWRRSGLLDRNNNPLPAYEAYTVFTDMLEGRAYYRDLSFTDETILGFEFETNDIPNLWVLFSKDGETKQIHRDQLPEWLYSVVDIFGNKVDFQNDKIYFNKPIYIKQNTAPTAVPDKYILNNGAPLTVRAPGVLKNDINYDGDTLVVEATTDPNFGDLVLNPDGSFTYTPIGTIPVEDTFTYSVSDGTFESTTTVTIIDGTWLFLPLIHR